METTHAKNDKQQKYKFIDELPHDIKDTFTKIIERMDKIANKQDEDSGIYNPNYTTHYEYHNDVKSLGIFFEELESLLKNNSLELKDVINLSIRNTDTHTLLSKAILTFDLDVIKLVLNKEPDIEKCRTRYGHPVLHALAMSGRKVSVKQYIEVLELIEKHYREKDDTFDFKDFLTQEANVASQYHNLAAFSVNQDINLLNALEQFGVDFTIKTKTCVNDPGLATPLAVAMFNNNTLKAAKFIAQCIYDKSPQRLAQHVAECNIFSICDTPEKLKILTDLGITPPKGYKIPEAKPQNGFTSAISNLKAQVTKGVRSIRDQVYNQTSSTAHKEAGNKPDAEQEADTHNQPKGNNISNITKLGIGASIITNGLGIIANSTTTLSTPSKLINRYLSGLSFKQPKALVCRLVVSTVMVVGLFKLVDSLLGNNSKNIS